MESLDWLSGTQFFGVKFGLENSRRLLALLPPWDPPPLTLHVAGTNGKGSACAFAEAIARAHGRRTGLFTSPHLIDFAERIRVDGRPIPDSSLDSILQFLRAAVQDWDPHPTYFELSLAAAAAHFRQEAVDCLILETGMGGRLDATSAFEPVSVSVLTRVDVDHAEWLGGSLEAIAAEKAGILRPGVPALSGPQEPAVLQVFEETARRRNCPFRLVDVPLHTPLGLAGPHQEFNAALARAALLEAGLPLQPETVAEALRTTFWPARFQQIAGSPPVVVDGAHNPAASAALRSTWESAFPAQRASLIFGALSDKDAAAMLRALEPVAARVFLVPVSGTARARDPAELLACAPAGSTVLLSLPEAFSAARAHPDPILVTGSLFLAGEALRAFGLAPLFHEG